MNVNYCLRRAARFHGNNTAVHHEQQRITYREFSNHVEHSARRMAALGMRKGDRVAVLMSNSPAYLNLYFSLPLLGALIVPINTRWHAKETTFTLNDSDASFLIVDERYLDVAREIRASVPSLKQVLYCGVGDCPKGLIDLRTQPPDATVIFEEPDENDLVGLFYTSGTTGGPKGAMLSHRNLYSNAVHCLLPPSFMLPETCFLHAAPMFHLADIGALLALTLTGASHSFLASFDPELLMQAIERYRISAVILVPTMINLLVNHPALSRYDLSSLDRVSYGASPMPLPLLTTAMQKLKCNFSQGYGMTEMSPLATVLLPEDHRLDEGFTPVSSAGKPILGVEVRVVDVNDVEVPTGEIGEITVRGPNVMQGYWKRPEISAEALRGGWMHTGDMGRFDEEGYLYILDRKKDMVKPGGENVYSPEVESVVCAHPAILEAAVIGVPDPKWGEAIRAVVSLRPGASVTESELIQFCRARLTHFKCPTSVVFTDTLPKGGTGKIQKSVLRERFGVESRSAAT